MSIVEAGSELDVAALIEPDRVHGRVYYDPAVFDREMREIWHKVWVYLGHESEIPAAGDYVRRMIGLHPVIMVRGSDDQIRVFSNRCRHRGNVICHKDTGNAREFVCAYHGWVYSNKGEFVAPSFGEAYVPPLQAEKFHLSPITRVDAYRGLVFGSLSADGVSLDAHLGEAKRFIDRIIDRSPLGRASLSAGMLGTSYRGNWKMLPENSLEGGYHGQFIHKFAFKLQEMRDGRDRRKEVRERPNAEHEEVLSLPGGHMVQDFYREGRRPAAPTAEYAAYLQQMEAAYGAERARDLTEGLPPMVYIFPNLMFIFTHFRRVQPVSVDLTHVYYHPALLEGVPPAMNEKIVRDHEQSFTPAGFLVPDDLQILERNQAGLLAGGEEWLFLGRGTHRERHRAQGGSAGNFMDENQLRGMWSHYAQLMGRH